MNKGDFLKETPKMTKAYRKALKVLMNLINCGCLVLQRGWECWKVPASLATIFLLESQKELYTFC